MDLASKKKADDTLKISVKFIAVESSKNFKMDEKLISKIVKC